MRFFAVATLAGCCAAICLADSPFPDTPKHHWVYSTMKQIRKEHLWYRANDNVPRRPVPTRMDVATKAFLLAVDCPNLVDSLRRTTALASGRPDDPQTKKWVEQFKKSFPKKKVLFQTHVKQVTRLWKYFKPEIQGIAKTYKVDPAKIGRKLANAQAEIDHLTLSTSVVKITRSKG